jgi:hypothetical protein
MWHIIFIVGIIFWTFFLAQKMVSVHAKREIFKWLPVLILIIFLIGCQIFFPDSIKKNIAEAMFSVEFTVFSICNIIFYIFFRIQKSVYIYTERFISKFIPVLILFALFTGCNILYYVDRYLLEKRGAIAMAYDMSKLIFYFCMTLILSALTGCICNFAFTLVNKIKISKAKNK